VLKASQSLLITSTEKELKSEAEGKIAYSARGKERGVPAREGGTAGTPLPNRTRPLLFLETSCPLFFFFFFFFFSFMDCLFCFGHGPLSVFFDTYTNVVHDAENKRNGVWPRVQSAGENKTREKNHGSWRVVCREKKKRRGEQDLVSVTARDQEHVRLAGGS
jgi:hypothetical protein